MPGATDIKRLLKLKAAHLYYRTLSACTVGALIITYTILGGSLKGIIRVTIRGSYRGLNNYLYYFGGFLIIISIV